MKKFQKIITKRAFVFGLLAIVIVALSVVLYLIDLGRREFIFREINLENQVTSSETYSLPEILTRIKDVGIDPEEYIESNIDKYKDQNNFKQIGPNAYTFILSNLKVLLISQDELISSVGFLYNLEKEECMEHCINYPHFPMGRTIDSYKAYVADWYNNNEWEAYISFMQYTNIPLTTIKLYFLAPIDPNSVDKGFIYGNTGSVEDLSEVIFKWYTE